MTFHCVCVALIGMLLSNMYSLLSFKAIKRLFKSWRERLKSKKQQRELSVSFFLQLRGDHQRSPWLNCSPNLFISQISPLASTLAAMTRQGRSSPMVGDKCDLCFISLNTLRRLHYGHISSLIAHYVPPGAFSMLLECKYTI